MAQVALSTIPSRHRQFTTAPTAGTWAVGEIVWNSAVGAAGPDGWVCVTAGTPGTWREFGYGRRVVGTGVAATDTAALQAAIDGLAESQGLGVGVIEVRGAILLNDTIEIDKKAIKFIGRGAFGNTPNFGSFAGEGTAFIWSGSAGIPMFTVTDSMGLQFEDIFFQGALAAVPSELVFFNNAGGSLGTNQLLWFRRCGFGAGSWTSPATTTGGADTATYAVRFGGTNGNNDQFRFDDCVFRNVGTGLKLDNSQSIWGLLVNCLFDNCNTAGLQTSANVTLVNPQFNACTIDIKLESTALVDVYGWQSENSELVAKQTGNGGYLKVRGGKIRVASGYAGTNLFEMDTVGGNGGLLLEGVFLDDAGNGGTMPKVKVDGNNSSSNGYVTIKSCPNLGLADLDITSNATGAGLVCDIQVEDHFIRTELTGGTSLKTTDSHYVTFSRGAGVSDPAADDILVWRAPYACTLTNIRAYQDTGTGTEVNAFKGSLASPTLFRAANYAIAVADTVEDAGSLQNTSVAAGDKVYIRIASVSGSPNEVIVQLDFTRTV